MATIVILEHKLQQSFGVSFMLYVLAERWRAAGHRVLVHNGSDNPPPGDLAILHVDLTVIPDEYRHLLGRYPRVINGAVLDISKRRISDHIVTRDTDWDGPVIVKTDANYGGQSEWLVHLQAQRAGVPSTVPFGVALSDYIIHNSVREVPTAVWSVPSLIVEKFLPEQDERGYYIRVWTFFGDRERSSRSRATVPVIKSRQTVERQTVPVPDEIRAQRARLGFDFGKFDYVMHRDRPVLLDVNRTPAVPAGFAEDEQRSAGVRSLADGLEVFLR